MKYYITIFLIFFHLFTSGQDSQKIDSLKKELNKKLSNKIKLNVLTNIFNTYLFINLDSAKVYKNKIIKQPNKSERDLIVTYKLTSKYYYYSSHYTLQKKHCKWH